MLLFLAVGSVQLDASWQHARGELRWGWRVHGVIGRWVLIQQRREVHHTVAVVPSVAAQRAELGPHSADDEVLEEPGHSGLFDLIFLILVIVIAL